VNSIALAVQHAGQSRPRLVNVGLVSGSIGSLCVPVIEVVVAGDRGKFAPMRKKSRKSDKIWLCCFNRPLFRLRAITSRQFRGRRSSMRPARCCPVEHALQKVCRGDSQLRLFRKSEVLGDAELYDVDFGKHLRDGRCVSHSDKDPDG
jgi:hypothetical protein